MRYFSPFELAILLAIIVLLALGFHHVLSAEAAALALEARV